MATRISMKHKGSGLMKDGYYGFSWTTLFFGFFPALLRGDFLTFLGGFVVVVILVIFVHIFVAFVAMCAWAFMYNSYYTRRLIEQGYEFVGAIDDVQMAAAALDVSIPKPVPSRQADKTVFPMNSSSTNAKEKKTLDNDAYKIYLVKKYEIESNAVLKKFILNDSLYDTVELALAAAHEKEIDGDRNKRWPLSEAIEYLKIRGYRVKSEGGGHRITFDKSATYVPSDTELIDYAESIKSRLVSSLSPP
jgi:hypothetical protein